MYRNLASHWLWWLMYGNSFYYSLYLYVWKHVMAKILNESEEVTISSREEQSWSSNLWSPSLPVPTDQAWPQKPSVRTTQTEELKAAVVLTVFHTPSWNEACNRPNIPISIWFGQREVISCRSLLQLQQQNTNWVTYTISTCVSRFWRLAAPGESPRPGVQRAPSHANLTRPSSAHVCADTKSSRVPSSSPRAFILAPGSHPQELMYTW